MNNSSVFGGMNTSAGGGGFGVSDLNMGGGNNVPFGADGNNNNNNNNKNNNGNSGKQICRFFQKGRCTYGDQCRFEHPGATKGSGDAFGSGNAGGGAAAQNGVSSGRQQGPQGQNAFGGGNNYQRGPGPKGGSGRPESKANVCKHWLKGRCKFGPGECRDYHPAADQEIILSELSEFPQWPLTGYGRKEQPSLVTGDFSPEELRIACYAQAFGGMPKEQIIENEAQGVTAQKQRFVQIVQECKDREEELKRQYGGK